MWVSVSRGGNVLTPEVESGLPVVCFSRWACIPFSGTPAQGGPPLASPRVDSHTRRRAPFRSAQQLWSRSSTALEHPRSDSLPSPHALGGESRMEMGWKHGRGAREAAGGRVEKAI